jgi:hypothetical protein
MAGAINWTAVNDPEPKRFNVALRAEHTIQSADESPRSKLRCKQKRYLAQDKGREGIPRTTSRMGKSYQYRQFLKLCENPTGLVISDTINGPKKTLPQIRQLAGWLGLVLLE